jgi:uncharacterized protein YhbP (UPF0306 family)
MTENYQEIALDFLESQDVCTLATASKDAVPEAATVRYMNDDDFNIYISTGSTYRKYQNTKSNSRVAIVVNGRLEDEYYNVQLEGNAKEIPYDDAEYIVDMYTQKYGSSQYLTNDQSVFFEIDTNWARLLVDGSYPPEYEMIIGNGDVDPHDAH